MAEAVTTDDIKQALDEIRETLRRIEAMVPTHRCVRCGQGVESTGLCQACFEFAGRSAIARWSNDRWPKP